MIGGFSFKAGDRVRPSREAVIRQLWSNRVQGRDPMDRRGVVTRVKSPTIVCVRWDPPVGRGGKGEGKSIYMGFLEKTP